MVWGLGLQLGSRILPGMVQAGRSSSPFLSAAGLLQFQDYVTDALGQANRDRSLNQSALDYSDQFVRPYLPGSISPASFDALNLYKGIEDNPNIQIPEYPSPALGSIVDPSQGLDEYITQRSRVSLQGEEEPKPAEPPVVRNKVGSVVPGKESSYQTVLDKIFDFLGGFGQSQSYGEGLARGVQAMTAGAEKREAQAKLKKAYMEQGFSEAQADAMVLDARYRDKMVEQQTKMRSLEGGRLGKDMEWVRDDKGDVVGQRVIKGSPTYMKRVEEYAQSQKAVKIVSEFSERFLNALNTAEKYLVGEDLNQNKIPGLTDYLPMSGRIAQGIAFISPQSRQGRIQAAYHTIKNNQILSELNHLRQMAKSGASGLGQTTHKELDVLGNVYGPLGIEYDENQMLTSIRQMRESIEKILKAQSDYAASLHPDKLYRRDEQIPEPFSAEKFLLDLLQKNQGSLGMSFEDAAKNVPVGGEFIGPDGIRYIKRAKNKEAAQ